jgi:hypothetical protein
MREQRIDEMQPAQVFAGTGRGSHFYETAASG